MSCISIKPYSLYLAKGLELTYTGPVRMRSVIPSLLCLCVAAGSCALATCDCGQTLYFALVVSNTSTFDTSGAVSAVDQALEQVNNILCGYTLKRSSIVLGTQVSSGLLHS